MAWCHEIRFDSSRWRCPGWSSKTFPAAIVLRRVAQRGTWPARRRTLGHPFDTVLDARDAERIDQQPRLLTAAVPGFALSEVAGPP